MRRILSNPITALAVGACLRFFFVFYYPAGSGDTVLYEQIAFNWLKTHVYAMNVDGVLTPVDTRVPGYPAFLALIYWLSGKIGPDAHRWIMSAQVFVDLLTCLVTAGLAVLLAVFASQIIDGRADPRAVSRVDDRAPRRRVFVVALWLAVLCPFTANYVAVLLTETWATFFTSLTLVFLCLLLLRFRAPTLSWNSSVINLRCSPEWFGAFAGFAAGLGTLFRPETPLVLIAACMVIGFYLLRSGRWLRTFRIVAFMAAGCFLPLLPWTVRNAVTLHEFQLLSPPNSTLPGELIPSGFMAWEKTWLFRMRDSYLVTWKLNDEAINLEDIPARAFDTPDEKGRVADLLEKYDNDLSLTPQEDAAFGQLAKERNARHPLRTYLEIPVVRACAMWLTPRIELLPFSGKVFPLAVAWEDDPFDQAMTIAFVLLNILYLVIAAIGAIRLWRHPPARIAVVLLIFFIVLRTAFLTTQEAPEPRYVLVCFPILLALAAQIFAGKEAATVMPPHRSTR